MRWILFCWVALAASSQSLRVYSELAVVDSTGEVTSPEEPREILSPAIARNAFASFQIVVQAPKGAHFALFVGQNPDHAVDVTIYRETGGLLERVALPFEGDETSVLWMDVWADRSAPVRRIKIEPQLNVNGDWVVYPMEARVMEAVVPDMALREKGSEPPVEVLRMPLCGQMDRRVIVGGDPTIRIAGLRFRNAQQDAKLVLHASEADVNAVRSLMGGCKGDPPANAESYLKIRDYLFRLKTGG